MRFKKITRTWAMPSKDTFTIKPIKELISTYMHNCSGAVCDPFVGMNPFKDYIDFTNDLNPAIPANSHLDALEFLTQIPSDCVSLLLFDPPYSPRQVSECYKQLGKTVNMQTTQSSYWGDLKKEISRVIKSNGRCITFGWNSGGIGKSNGFEIEEILLVAHGGWHNDTIVTVDRRR